MPLLSYLLIRKQLTLSKEVFMKYQNTTFTVNLMDTKGILDLYPRYFLLQARGTQFLCPLN